MVSFEDFRQEDGVPIYLQIVRHLKAAVAAGTVADGEEMPSRRVLSARLGVNPNTVQKAYRQLEEEGLITSRAGAKSYVSAPPERAEALRRELPAWSAAAFVARMRALGLSLPETTALIERLWKEAEP